MILILFYNASTVCLFVLVLRGWEYGGGRLRGIVGHFQISVFNIASRSANVCASSSPVDIFTIVLLIP
jgi:hypothetical protein